MNTVINKVENILTSEYTISNFVEFVQEVFSNIEFVAPDKFNKEFSNFSSHIEGSTHVGNYTDSEGNSIIIAAVQLKSRAYVENSRSIQRNYAKKLIENAASEAAFIAFYTEGESKWRISFVRLDYEMKFENGKMKTSEDLTPAKRYSYLVGRDEPCHTAIDRFKIFIEDNNSMPTLDQMEDVFSVEAVTNEFFKLYCEKFHQVREYLESNEDFVEEAKQHNFTAAQFTKKLMGQIVFLYFLQKKGWLGVNALPKTMTEKEYKNAFYSRGAKSREIIPIAYRQNPEDELFYLMPKGIATLNDEDETILAQCVKGQPWGTGPKNFMRKLFETSQKKGANFFDDYLEPLFYNALNVNRGEQGYDPILHCRIPFLSGGLFEPIDGYEWEYNDFGIPNELFSNRINNNPRTGDGILDIFDRYNFTMSEDEPLEREVAIDPEMLGKVFENLLDVNDRKSKGAFYTPREIVHYMCQESLINYLTKEINVSEAAVRDFILYGDFMKGEDTVKEKRQGNGTLYISEELYKLDNNGNVVTNKLVDMDRALENVRVADPAVGSGAFPLGMLNEIVRARQNISAYYSITMNPNQTRLMYSMERSPYALKYQTIKNCIYAADIEPSAVDIAQLRLWLSLVIDDEINPNADPNNPLEGHRNPTPLPNLECNILCGDSLIDEFEGIKLINQDEILGTATVGDQTNIWGDSFSNILPRLIDAQDRLFRCDDTNKKHEIMNEISAIKDMIILSQMEGVDSEIVDRYKESKKLASKPYVLWQLDFARVFKEKGGFDIVIGNPPYVDSEEMTRSMPELREKYSKIYTCAKGNWDLFVLFIEKGINLLHINSIFSFIVPNKLVAAKYTEAIRKKISETQIIEMRDYSNVNVFKSASVYPVVFRLRMCDEKESVAMNVMRDLLKIDNNNVINSNTYYKDINWDKYFKSTRVELGVIEKMCSFPRLSEIAKVNGAATVNEAYLVKEFIYDTDNVDLCNTKRFINTGGIDKYKSLVGIEPIRYLKGKYANPVVNIDDLKSMSEKRLSESNSEKIIIGGMTKELECYYDEGNYLAGKSTTIVYGSNHLKLLIAILNSKLITFFYSVYFNSMSLAGGFYRIGAPQIKEIPIAIPEDSKVIDTVEQLVDKIQIELASIGNNNIVDAIMNQLDSYVYSFYGLTDEEIIAVENFF